MSMRIFNLTMHEFFIQALKIMTKAALASFADLLTISYYSRVLYLNISGLVRKSNHSRHIYLICPSGF